jgi:hypothetical protein
MRNVTVSLDEAVADWARVWAAKHNTSVSRMLGELLESRMAEEDAYATAMSRYLAGKPMALKDAASRYPSREDVHDRA